MMKTKEDVKNPRGPHAEVSHDEIAKEMGVSRAYVSLLEKSALAKIKRALRARYNIHATDDLL
jgi:transcriptional regulator